MIFDCVFLHRNVLEAVTSPGSPRRPLPERSSRPPLLAAPLRARGAPHGRHGRPGLPLLLPLSRRSGDPAELAPERGPRGAGAGAGRVLVAQVAGVGRAGAGDVPWPGSARAGAVGVALGHAGTQRLRNWSPRFVYPLYISQT